MFKLTLRTDNDAFADDGASIWINTARCWDRFTVEEGAQ